MFILAPEMGFSVLIFSGFLEKMCYFNGIFKNLISRQFSLFIRKRYGPCEQRHLADLCKIN